MISALIIGILLAPQAIAHQGNVMLEADRPTYASVTVKSCETHEPIAIYQDSKMTTPLSNPFITDPFGEWIYFTGSPYSEEIVSLGDRYAVIKNCPANKAKR